MKYSLIKMFSSNVLHLKCSFNEILLSNYILTSLKLNKNEINSLISLGSIYYLSVQSNEKPKRILNDRIIFKDDYLRIYLNTSRYNVNIINWKSLILYDCDDFIVVNKPAGLFFFPSLVFSFFSLLSSSPFSTLSTSFLYLYFEISFYYLGISSNPTVGNYQENVAECIRKYLNIEQIYLPHRLDSDTSGVLILGKTQSYAKNFLKMQYRKKYRTLITWRTGDNDQSIDENENNNSIQLPSVGSILTHYMENTTVQPKFVHLNQVEDSKICQSIVTGMSQIISRSISEWDTII